MFQTEVALRIYRSLEFNFKLAVNPEFQECIYCLLNFHAKPPPQLSSLESHINFSPRRTSEASNSSGIFDGFQKLVWTHYKVYPKNGCAEKCGQCKSLNLTESIESAHIVEVVLSR